MPQEANSSLVAQLKAWRNGIDFELRWWDEWMQTRGLEWPDLFAERMRADRPFSLDYVRPGTPLDSLKVLDVGAGPITSLGLAIEGRPIDLTACDPLAPFYAALAARHSIEFPLKTEQAFAEDLTSFYALEAYDLVYCRNALDHSFDPIRAIGQMLMVARPAGRVFLEHHANEAENAAYDGFHQWNFDVRDGRFIVWNKTHDIDASALFAPGAQVTATKSDNWVVVCFDKIADAPADKDRLLPQANDRIKELLAAMLASSAEDHLEAISAPRA